MREREPPTGTLRLFLVFPMPILSYVYRFINQTRLIDAHRQENVAVDMYDIVIIMYFPEYIPENPALPAGQTEWKGGDKYDRLCTRWEKNDSIPVRLR